MVLSVTKSLLKKLQKCTYLIQQELSTKPVTPGVESGNANLTSSARFRICAEPSKIAEITVPTVPISITAKQIEWNCMDNILMQFLRKMSEFRIQFHMTIRKGQTYH